jgi:DNA-binding beta-propeller fold protein YncE
VEDSKVVMTGGFRPYAIQVSPRGDIAIVGNQGGNTGDVDTINVVDLRGKTPHIIRTLDVGQVVEGLAFSNDGKYVALTAQDGSARAPNHPFYNDHGLLVVFGVNGTDLTKVAEAKIGKWNQGVVWGHDGKTLLAQNMVEQSLSVLSFDGKNLNVTGEIKVQGGPDGLRTAER